MLTFSSCVLFQTSSKKACETNKKHKQLDNLTKAIKGSISGRNFHNIRRQWIKKEVPHKMLVKKQQQQTGNLNLTKQRASPEGKTFTLSEENCIKKELWTVLKNIVL